MSRTCQICGKKTQSGNSIARRGKAKYLGGVGRKITGVTHRKFLANLQRIRVELPNGTRKRMAVCAQCIRSGRIKKPSKRQIPEAAKV